MFAGVTAWVPTGSASDHRVRAVSCLKFLSLENSNLGSYLIPPEQSTLKTAQAIQQFLQGLQVCRGLTPAVFYFHYAISKRKKECKSHLGIFDISLVQKTNNKKLIAKPKAPQSDIYILSTTEISRTRGATSCPCCWHCPYSFPQPLT